MTDDILQRLTGNWWTFLLRGIVALALAVFAFLDPVAMAAGLVFFVAAYFIFSGAVSLFAGFSFSGIGSWWALILLGLSQAFLGIIMLTQPGAGPLALAYLVAIWAFSTGFMEISSAIALRNYIKDEFWWILLGLVTIVLGFYIVMRPDVGVLALVYTIGFYAVLAAGTLIGLAFRIKSLPSTVRKVAQAVEGAPR